MAFQVFALPQRNGQTLWPSQGATQNACATGCAVHRAWRGVVTDRHRREQKQDRSLLPGLAAKLLLVRNQIHAACLFVGMWEFIYIKTEKTLWLLPLHKFNCGFIVWNRSKVTFKFHEALAYLLEMLYCKLVANWPHTHNPEEMQKLYLLSSFSKYSVPVKPWGVSLRASLRGLNRCGHGQSP